MTIFFPSSWGISKVKNHIKQTTFPKEYWPHHCYGKFEQNKQNRQWNYSFSVPEVIENKKRNKNSALQFGLAALAMSAPIINASPDRAFKND